MHFLACKEDNPEHFAIEDSIRDKGLGFILVTHRSYDPTPSGVITADNIQQSIASFLLASFIKHRFSLLEKLKFITKLF